MDKSRATRRTFLSASGGLLGLVGTGGALSDLRVDPGLRARTGETDVVLRLDTADTPDGAPPEAVRDYLKSHAESVQSEVRAALADESGVSVTGGFWLANALVATVDTDRTRLDDLVALDGVDRVHAADAISAGGDTVTTENAGASGATAVSPQADIFDEQDVSWVLDLLNVPAVWDRYGTRGEGARVAILDTGVDTSHPDIDLTEWAEFDAQGQRVDSEPSEVDRGVGHGTWVSTLATGGDASGMAIGVAPDAELYVAGFGEYNFPAVLAGLEWAVENDADVASMSFTMETRWLDVIEPVENAVAAGTLPIIAVEWPIPFLSNATTPEMLVTAPITRDLVPRQGANGGQIRWERALRGSEVPEDWPADSFVPDVSVPGEEVPSGVSGPQFPDRNWVPNGRGASATPPFVAGSVALLQSATDGRLSATELRETVRTTAFQPADAMEAVPNTRLGYGIPDTARAVARHVDGDRTVSGVVTGDSGSPVAGAMVRAASGVEAATDQNGAYSLSAPDGEETLTASAVGYEPVETTVADGASTADIAFETRVAPAIERAEREATQLVPGETLTLAFDIAHADGARVTLEGSGRRVSPEDFAVSINGMSTAVGAEIALEDRPSTLSVEITAHENARGVARFAVGVANLAGDEPITTELPLDPVHVHDQPLTVADGDSLQQALDAAAPDTRVELADAEWTVDVGATEPTFDDSLLDYPPAAPVLERARDDEAALVVDKPLTLTATDGADPTIVVDDAGSAERSVALRLGASYVTVSDLTVDAGGAVAGVSVLNGTGVTVENVTVTNADHGLLGELTLSLLARSNDFTAADTGVRLSWIAWNALVTDNDLRDAGIGVELDSGFLITETRLAGNRFEGVGSEVETTGEGELSYDRTEDQSDDGQEGDDQTPDGSGTPADPEPATPTATATDTETAGESGTTATTSGDDGAGFGVGAALTGVGGLAYILRRRLGSAEEP